MFVLNFKVATYFHLKKPVFLFNYQSGMNPLNSNNYLGITNRYCNNKPIRSGWSRESREDSTEAMDSCQAREN